MASFKGLTDFLACGNRTAGSDAFKIVFGVLLVLEFARFAGTIYFEVILLIGGSACD